MSNLLRIKGNLTPVGVGLAEVWRGGGLDRQLGHGHLTRHGVSSTQTVFSVRAHLQGKKEHIVNV